LRDDALAQRGAERSDRIVGSDVTSFEAERGKYAPERRRSLSSLGGGAPLGDAVLEGGVVCAVQCLSQRECLRPERLPREGCGRREQNAEYNPVADLHRFAALQWKVTVRRAATVIH